MPDKNDIQWISAQPWVAADGTVTVAIGVKSFDGREQWFRIDNIAQGDIDSVNVQEWETTHEYCGQSSNDALHERETARVLEEHGEEAALRYAKDRRL
jgi:hypothetical protein